MSPLYLVFKINGINKDFLCYYYKTKKWHRFMKLSGNCGARFDRLSISDDKFVKMPIIHPNNTKEQNQICKVFENLDDLIEKIKLNLLIVYISFIVLEESPVARDWTICGFAARLRLETKPCNAPDT